MANSLLTDAFVVGAALLPSPQIVTLQHAWAAVGRRWSLSAGPGVALDDFVATQLAEQLVCRTALPVATDGGEGLKVTLSIAPGEAAGEQKLPEPIARQAYRITVAGEAVELMGNSPAGLFYAAQTLLQLLRFAPGAGWTLPVGRIEDWPDHELRLIHYDTKHHQETLEGVKRIIERAAHFKINGMLWEIEDKFAYEKHPDIAAPGAFTQAELAELTAYARSRHVEIVPILQMPSHNAFIAKHPAYAELRENPDNNYMLCPSNPKTVALYQDMIGELIAATPGARFFHLGTDEPYFLGEGPTCACREMLKTRGKGGIFAEFISRMANWVRDTHGREVMYWGEHPMTAADVKDLPPGTINCVQLEVERSKAYKDRGIREIVYTPTQGTRLFFPDYWPPAGSLATDGRLAAMAHKIRADGQRFDNVMGTLVAAWDDSGLNSETFWLGWAAGSAVGWNARGGDVDEMVACFMHSFYGPSARGMADAYVMLNEVVEFWINSWNRVPSRRGPSFMRRYHPRLDLTLPLPNIPDPETLDNRPFWKQQHAELLGRANLAGIQFERLAGLLCENLLAAEREHHNIEVLLSIARLLGHHVNLLKTLARIEDELSAARKAWDVVRPNDAVGHMQSAVRLAKACIAEREARYLALVATWEKTRKPRGMSQAGRDFAHIQDDTKNHTGDHTPDLGYVVEAERNLGLEAWAARLEAVIEQYRQKFGAISPEPDYMMD